jgi:excisionase family DNA binding protein
MARHRINPRLVKIHLSYTVDEAARRLKTHKNTIRNWIKLGLPVIDGRRPALVHGRDLAAFIDKRRQSRKQTCPPGHLYCVKCRTPREPAGQMAEKH